MKTCREHAELDLIKGRQTWPVRFMLIDLALYSGLRVGEMAALKVGDISFKEPDPFIIVTDSINETWDASECKGIKSIYSIRGSKGQTKTGVYVNTYV